MPVSPLPITAAQLPAFRVCVDFGVGRIVVVGVSGELDVVTAPQLDSLLAVLVGQAGTDIVIDFSDLEFMDANGLRVIARAATQLRPTGRRLTLRSVPPMARRILALTGVGGLVDIEPSGVVPTGRAGLGLEEASDALRGRSVLHAPASVHEGAIDLVMSTPRETLAGL